MCLTKTRTGKSHDYGGFTVIEKICFQSVFRPHLNALPAFSNSSGLKNVFEKFRFVTNSYGRCSVTAVIKLSFQISPVYCRRELN